MVQHGRSPTLISQNGNGRPAWRPLHRLALCLAPALVVLCLYFCPENTPEADSPGPEGVWEQVGSGRSAFRYDGRHVTLDLVPRWTWEWRPWDFHWRLESEWLGDDLLARGPYGNWSLVGTFAEGSFCDESGLRYRKVGFWEAAWGYPQLLRPRGPHDYSLNPSERGRLWPGWARWLWPVVEWGQDRPALLAAFLLALAGGLGAARWWSRLHARAGRTAP